MPQACKEVLHPYAIEAMDTVIFLLGFTQNCLPNIRHDSVQAALTGAIMSTYFKTEELPMCSQRTTLIPNHYKKLKYKKKRKGPSLGFDYLLTYKTLHYARTACTAFPYASVPDITVTKMTVWFQGQAEWARMHDTVAPTCKRRCCGACGGGGGVVCQVLRAPVGQLCPRRGGRGVTCTFSPNNKH